MLTEARARFIRRQSQFQGFEPFEQTIRFTAPIVHEEETEYVCKALESGSIGTSGDNIDALEQEIAEYTGVGYAVALSSAAAAMHLAVKLAAERLYSTMPLSVPNGKTSDGALSGKRVFCPDFISVNTINPVLCEGGEPIFVDMSPCDWGVDPETLEIAFEHYPDVRLVVFTHSYGFPGQIEAVRGICRKHDALLIEDASESFGAKCRVEKASSDGMDKATELWRQTGSFGDCAVLSFDENQIITGGTGGMLLTNDYYSAKKAKYWATQSQADAPWRQHEELGFDYGMSNVTAGIIRGQFLHLDEHIAKKKAIYERYREKLSEDIIYMNPIGEGTEPNYNVSCILSESGTRFQEVRSEWDYLYKSQCGTATPMEIWETLSAFNVECHPVWKPMSMQPMFRNCEQITLDGSRWMYENFDRDGFLMRCNYGGDVFAKGLCLPSGIGMTEEEQERVIDMIYACFDSER